MPSASTDTLASLVDLMPSPDLAARLRDYVSRHLPRFQDALASFPITADAGSVSLAEAFWLHRLAAELRPSMIVDSGSATGWSAFVLASGAPETRVLCFDPYRAPDALPPNAEYLSGDWTVSKSLPANTLALFDDHVNQRLRVGQARRAGLRNAVFHDVYPTLTHSTVSLRFVDLLGIASASHTFDPLWGVDPAFHDASVNPQRYRWLTWVQLRSGRVPVPLARMSAMGQRYRRRNPGASERSRANWRSRP
jgi:hypothetical protein